MNKIELESVTIRFSGDSGDGMQLTGTQFSNTSALMGNELSTFPDFPAEIRAPQGTVAGVSGFQVNIGSVEVRTPGDEPDVLVAMNPAALKANIEDVSRGGTIICNTDAFTDLNLKKAGYAGNPLDTHQMDSYKIIKANITTQTKEALADVDIDSKGKARCKNFYALGMTYFMYSRQMDATVTWIKEKFKGKPALIEANTIALKAGYNFAETLELIDSSYTIRPAAIEKGKYRQINGNTATAWGFLCAAEKSGLDIFFGSYPITPASDVLHELSKHKNFGVKTFQAEDEIAAACSAIGASFSGALGVTSSSGPGIALKGEAIGLAVILELPLVVINVQRGGPSTGLPTKTEQSDLFQAMYGRNGDSPMIVVAPSTPGDCFHMAYEASRLSIEHMTPVMYLSDGFIANGSEPWLIPDTDANYPKITPKIVDESSVVDGKYLPYKRDKDLVRQWAIPGMKGYEHRVGGLEKQVDTGNVCYDGDNHAEMCRIRAQKVANVANYIPKQAVEGDLTGDLLVLSWGGTYGATHTAVKEAREAGQNVSLMHLKYINPMPTNVESILKGFKKVVVCELNGGQMQSIINGKFSIGAEGYTKLQGKPFKIRELVGMINNKLENL